MVSISMLGCSVAPDPVVPSPSESTIFVQTRDPPTAEQALAIPDMPSSPLGDEIYDNLWKTLRLWPTLGLSIEFALDEESPVGDKEMSIARKDFECRESSGFTHEYYIKRWDYQSKKLAENPELADALEKTTALVEETMSKLRVMIAEHVHD
jgi:hypothetical protein